MLNSVANQECVNFAEKMPDPIKTLSHTIFNMSLAIKVLFLET
jgi:hypothetical protein